jgi:hypothetical protein
LESTPVTAPRNANVERSARISVNALWHRDEKDMSRVAKVFVFHGQAMLLHRLSILIGTDSIFRFFSAVDPV